MTRLQRFGLLMELYGLAVLVILTNSSGPPLPDWKVFVLIGWLWLGFIFIISEDDQ